MLSRMRCSLPCSVNSDCNSISFIVLILLFLSFSLSCVGAACIFITQLSSSRSLLAHVHRRLFQTSCATASSKASSHVPGESKITVAEANEILAKFGIHGDGFDRVLKNARIDSVETGKVG